MGEVIRDEDQRRRVRLAQEFLDPGMSGARHGRFGFDADRPDQTM